MLYMPASALATPIVLQEIQSVPPPQPRYMMLQPATTIVPTLSFLNSGFVYPSYSFLTKTNEKTDNQTSTTSTPSPQQTITQHIVHHCTCSARSCPGYCELCCPWINETSQRQIPSRSPTPPLPQPERQQQRYSRRDQYEQTAYDPKHETIDEKIERIRRELNTSSFNKHDKSTETIDYYHPRRPTPPVEERVPYKQHYDAPKSRSNSRPRSSSSHRASSLPREPWRSANQNDYPWRDAHLPAYREVTLARAQTPIDQTRTWSENSHQQSHSNTENAKTYYANKDYIYRPKSETEVRKWYTQTTGKDADREVYQALNCARTTAHTHPSSNIRQSTSHSFYSDVPTVTKTHSLHKIDATQYHNLYGCNEPCLHIIPKQSNTLDPPYLKILNAPVTYLH